MPNKIKNQSFSIKFELEGITKVRKKNSKFPVYYIKTVSVDGFVVRRNLSVQSTNMEEIMKQIKKKFPKTFNVGFLDWL